MHFEMIFLFNTWYGHFEIQVKTILKSAWTVEN